MSDAASHSVEMLQLRAITDAMTVYLDRSDVGAASQPLLAGALDLTGSEYGFVGVVVEGPVLRVLAHRGIVWHRTANRAFYEAALRTYEKVGYLEFKSFATLFGHVLLSGHALIANDAASHPAAGGIPAGHPPLHHFLGVPFLWGDEVVGMIGVANRPGGYREVERLRLESLAGAAGVLYDSYRRRERQAEIEAQRRQAESALRDSNRRLEQALYELGAAQDRLVREERLRALGLMASGIAHDFNNALQGILGYAEYLLAAPELLEDRAETLECLGMIRTSAWDASRLVDRLGAFYRKREANEPRSPVELDALLEEVVALTRPRWRDESLAHGASIRVVIEAEGAPVLLGDGQALREALTNLVFNAVDAMPEGGTLSLRAGSADGRAYLEVEDTGVGMDEDVRVHCLEPFFSTKVAPRTGMGLAMVWGVVRRHEGDVEVETAPGRGTCVRLWLPLVSARSPAADPPALGPPPPELPRLRVLVADDEPAVRDVIARTLRRDGHEVEVVSGGREALARLEGAGLGGFDLLLADQAMPDPTGLELARHLAARGAGLPVLLLSGFADRLQDEIDGSPGVTVVLKKPVHPNALRDALAKACAGVAGGGS